MIPPELAGVYGDSPYEHQKFMKLSATFAAPEMRDVNVFGVVVSSTLPKPCASRASHKYACSFFIIDPFYSTPTSPIGVNLFLHSNQEFQPSCNIGDVIICQGTKLQKYRDFPQLVGNFEKASIVVFKNKRQTILDRGVTDEEEADTRRGILRPEDWEVLNYTLNKVKLNEIDSLLSGAIIRLSNWAHDFFKSQSMADSSSFPHYNIHSLLHHYNIFHNRTDFYRQLFPPHIQCTPAASLSGAIGPEVSKLDVIGLVVSNIKGTGSTPTRLLLWDGTGNGYYPTIPGAARHISAIDRGMQSAADAAEIWKQFVQRAASFQSPATESEVSNNSNNSNSSTAAAVTAAVPTWNKELFLGSFLVIESHDLPNQCQQQNYLTTFQPGNWIRLRNITVTNTRTDFGVPVGEVRLDAHVSFLQPYFRDVRTLIGEYFVRVDQHLSIREHQLKQQEEAHQRQAQQAAATAGQGNAPSTVAHRHRHVSDKGHPQTSLAWIMALPAPPVDTVVVEFFVAGVLLSWYPTDATKFVESTVLEDGSTKYSFLFSLRIFDFTEPAQVIFADKEAEAFLGITAKAYAENPSYAKTLDEKLTEAKESNSVIKTYVHFYTKNLVVPGRKSSKGRTAAPKKRILKRMMAFDAVAPFQLPAVNNSITSPKATRSSARLESQSQNK